jgi:hypothetical protein
MFSRKGAKPQRKRPFSFCSLRLCAFAPLREALIQTNPLPSRSGSDVVKRIQRRVANGPQPFAGRIDEVRAQ